jgi:hypothetical protein
VSITLDNDFRSKHMSLNELQVNYFSTCTFSVFTYKVKLVGTELDYYKNKIVTKQVDFIFNVSILYSGRV